MLFLVSCGMVARKLPIPVPVSIRGVTEKRRFLMQALPLLTPPGRPGIFRVKTCKHIAPDGHWPALASRNTRSATPRAEVSERRKSSFCLDAHAQSDITQCPSAVLEKHAFRITIRTRRRVRFLTTVAVLWCVPSILRHVQLPVRVVSGFLVHAGLTTRSRCNPNESIVAAVRDRRRRGGTAGSGPGETPRAAVHKPPPHPDLPVRRVFSSVTGLLNTCAKIVRTYRKSNASTQVRHD